MDPNVITPTPSSPVAPVANIPPQQPSSFSLFQKYKKFMILGGVVVLIGILGIVLFTSLKDPAEKEYPPVPSEMDQIMAKVGDIQIYKDDVWRAARKQYAGDAIDQEVLILFLNKLIEQTILDIEAKKIGISVSEDEISIASNNATSETLREQFKYQILRNKLMSEQVESVRAYMIGFWVRSLDDPDQQPIFAQQRIDGAKALSEIEVKLKAGEKPIEAARTVYTQYESLKQIWAFNGYLLDKPNDEHVYEVPEQFTFDKDELAALDDPEVYAVLQSMPVGSVRRVMRSNGAGGVVIKLEDKTTGEFADYDTFLQTRKNELVTIY
ncbi:MAG TPA: SurA N-terminal domain-containing protein [Candidatus Levybacteria bacterium]|nr:SurA N-terminal domain-containing protein [Candidatus Levybacteria bacterium]